MAVPFLWLLVCFASGILVRMASIDVPQWCLFTVFLLCALSLKKGGWRVGLTVHLLWFLLLGHATLDRRERAYENDLRARVAAHPKEVVRLSGIVVQTPEIGPDFFTVRVRLQKYQGSSVTGMVRLTVAGQADKYPVTGDRIEALAWLRLPAHFQSEGSFDYRRYLKKEGIHVLGSVKNSRLLYVIGKDKSFRGWISALRLKMILRIRDLFSPASGGVLRALWLDDRSALDARIESSMIDAGIFHVVAISGFHVAIILFCFFLLFKYFFRFQTAIVLVSILMLFYFLLLEGRSSITRSFLMFLAFVIARLHYEPLRRLNTLCASAFLQLVGNPYELFDPGYHLTYLSTAAILFVALPVTKKLKGLPGPLRTLATGLIVSLCIQFVLIPYQAEVFYKVPLGSLLSNLFAVPLSSFLITGGLIFLPFAFLQPLTQVFLEKAVQFFIHGCALFSGLWLRIVPDPPLVAVLMFYGFLVALLICKRFPVRLLFLTGCVLLLVYIVFRTPTSASDELRIHFIDVGQGDAILIEYPDGSFDMVDGGGSWNPDVLDIGEMVLLPYLCEKGVTQLNRVFLTHAHADHMHGLSRLLQYIPANHFYLSRRPLAEPGFQQLIHDLPLNPVSIHAGQTFHQAGVKITVLSPPDARRTLKVRNDDSLILLLEYRGKKILLTGDAEKMTEEQLIQKGELAVDVLKVPHHGSMSSSSESFLSHIKPKLAFISVGKDNWFGHPHPEIVKRYRQHHTMLFRTDLSGTLQLQIGNEGLRIDAYAWK